MPFLFPLRASNGPVNSQTGFLDPPRLPSHWQSTWLSLDAQQIFVEPTEIPGAGFGKRPRIQHAGLNSSPCPSLWAWLSPHRVNRGCLTGSVGRASWRGVYVTGVFTEPLVLNAGWRMLTQIDVWEPHPTTDSRVECQSALLPHGPRGCQVSL